MDWGINTNESCWSKVINNQGFSFWQFDRLQDKFSFWECCHRGAPWSKTFFWSLCLLATSLATHKWVLDSSFHILSCSCRSLCPLGSRPSFPSIRASFLCFCSSRRCKFSVCWCRSHSESIAWSRSQRVGLLCEEVQRGSFAFIYGFRSGARGCWRNGRTFFQRLGKLSFWGSVLGWRWREGRCV